MESSAALRSFQYSLGAVSQAHCSLERPSTVHMYSGCWPTSRKSCVPGLMFGTKNNSSTARNVTQISCVKTPEATATTKSKDSTTQGSLEKKPSRNATFPNGFEELNKTFDSNTDIEYSTFQTKTPTFEAILQALLLEVCDETEIAELKMKVGDFEMHVKRNVGAAKDPFSNISPTIAPPIPTEPMTESAPAAPPPSPPKPSPEKPNPFKNVSFGNSPKLAALEASGFSNYVVVPSPIVGTFRRGRTIKGQKQPPICKEGNLIKEGQVIGYLDQFGTEIAVKSDVDGEVLKLLFDDGDAVGYGDPLIAVLPSFHSIGVQ